MTLRQMLLEYARMTGDLLTPLALTVAVVKVVDNWTESDSVKYGSSIENRLKELERELTDKSI